MRERWLSSNPRWVTIYDLPMTTKKELMTQAQELDIAGRSSMSKEELEKAIASAQKKQARKDAKEAAKSAPDETNDSVVNDAASTVDSPASSSGPAPDDDAALAEVIPLQQGSRDGHPSHRGALVAELQGKLKGVAVTGVFGPSTERAVRRFQEDHGLPVTGVADEATLRAIS